ncbi:MAG: stalk domain-containing protein, partial [Armatimonadota bacterium]|nr:stalk domain-containing protein [Armatimonadota bacterium]
LPVNSGASLGSPRVSIEDPSVSGQVQGKVTIRMKAEDPSGKPPYVSLFVDRKFKTLRNYAPYEFEWDTTQYPNGYHTIDAFGYNDAQDVGHAHSMRVLVNNPGGQTQRRTDLQDAPKAADAAVAEAPVKPARVKAAPALRRPTPAMLAQATPTASAKRAQPKSQKIARLPEALPQEAMALQGQPALGDPFVQMPVMVTPAKSATPTNGFKPLMAVAPTAHARAASGTYLLHAKLGLPSVALPTPVQTAVRLPSIKASVKTMETVAAKRTLRVSFPTAKVHASHAQALMPHTIHATSQLSWLHAAGQKTLMFNSTRLPLERPLTAKGSVMFGPLRQIFESGGGSLMWQSRTGVVTARSKDKNVSLAIGQKNARVNDTSVTLDSAPYINQGRTMIPLSFLKAAMDVNVQYDEATGHLLVTSK